MEVRQENEFVSLDLPELSQETIKISTGELNFLPTNYDLNETKSSDNNGSNTSNNFGDLGIYLHEFFLVSKPRYFMIRRTPN